MNAYRLTGNISGKGKESFKSSDLAKEFDCTLFSADFSVSILLETETDLQAVVVAQEFLSIADNADERVQSEISGSVKIERGIIVQDQFQYIEDVAVLSV